jgi:hypothetical protein
MNEIKNAKISCTMLGYEDHGIFTFSITLDYGGSGQGAGGYCIYSKGDDSKNGYAMGIIPKILKTVGVNSWEQLKGKYIRVNSCHEEVKAIGNLLEDKWLNFKEYFSNKKGAK